MNSTRIKYLLFIVILSFLFGCGNTLGHKENESESVKTTEKGVSFDMILKCSVYAYNDGYFFTPDYGCIYSPGKGNNLGNVMIYLIPKKQLNITDEQADIQTKRINTLNADQYKEDFSIYVYVIDKRHLNYNKTGDPVYYQKDNFTEEVYTYNDKSKKWNLIDSINITGDPNKEQIWRDGFINKQAGRSNIKPAETTSNNHISDIWYGIYSVTVNEDHSDWREIQDISLSITKDSIIYHAQGYQTDQTYRLSGTENNNCLKLQYQSAVDNVESDVLKKTKDFGAITKDSNTYKWSCPYIDLSFGDGKSKIYTIVKKQP